MRTFALVQRCDGATVRRCDPKAALADRAALCRLRGLRRRAETTDRQEAMSEARAGCLARDPRRRLAHILTVAWATRELRPDEDLARDKILVWAAWRRDG